MKTRFCLILMVAALTAAVWIAVFFVRNRPASPVPAQSHAEAEASMNQTGTNSPASFAEAREFPIYHWPTAARACWQFGISLRQANAPEKINECPETRVGGKLHLVVLSADAGQVILAGALTNAYYVAENQR